MAVTNVNLSDTLSTFVTKANTIATDLGDTALLTTNADSNVVAAINSLDSEVTANQGSIGSLNTNASTLVGAINEILALVDSDLNEANEIKGLFASSTSITFDSSAGQFSIAAGATDSSAIADGAISTAKIQDGAIDSDKLGTDAVSTIKIQNDAITQNKIADNAVGTSQLVHQAANTVLKMNSSGTPTAATIVTDNIADDAVSRAKLKDEVELIIYNSSGTAVKTIYGAGS